ncbi:hypothetical protein J6590_033807 [Homalodisca vitripennis]|nr:hypothetical protein J6590_033807 [Homalodisca vitripennis]
MREQGKGTKREVAKGECYRYLDCEVGGISGHQLIRQPHRQRLLFMCLMWEQSKVKCGRPCQIIKLELEVGTIQGRLTSSHRTPAAPLTEPLEMVAFGLCWVIVGKWEECFLIVISAILVTS